MFPHSIRRSKNISLSLSLSVSLHIHVYIYIYIYNIHTCISLSIYIYIVLRRISGTVIVPSKNDKQVSQRFAETTNPHKHCTAGLSNPGSRDPLSWVRQGPRPSLTMLRQVAE